MQQLLLIWILLTFVICQQMLQDRLLVGNLGVAFYCWKREILNLPVLQGWLLCFYFGVTVYCLKKIMDFKTPVSWGCH